MMKVWFAAVLILLLHFVILFHSAAQKSATVDELSHLAAGLYSYTTLDFRVNRGAPPLQSVLCAALVWHTTDVNLSFDNESWNKGIWNGAGDRLLEANPERFHEILSRARVMSMALSVMLCLLVFVFTRALWGDVPALIVLAFTALEPNLLAHGRLVTTDTATTLFFLGVGYSTWRYLQKPSWVWLIATGWCVGAMWLNKQSAIVVPAALVLVFALANLPESPFRFPAWVNLSPAMKRLLRGVCLGALVMLIALVAVWVGFAFEVGGSIPDQTPTDSALWLELQVPMRSALYFAGMNDLASYDPTDPENPFWQLMHSYLPAYTHWENFSKARQHVRGGHRGYLMGELSNSGFLWFYPVLFLIKTPVAILLLTFVGCWAMSRSFAPQLRNTWLVLIVPLVYLVVLVFFNTASIGYRHAMPVIPFLLVWIGGAAASALWHGTPKGKHLVWPRGLLAVLLLWGTIDVMRYHPHHLSYFNQLVGGCESGHLYAVDSNLDWGQDLLVLREYVEREEIGSYTLIYFGPQSLPPAYGLTFREQRREDPLEPGLYVISASVLHGIGRPDLYDKLSVFRESQPITLITPALMLYEVAP